MSKSQTKESLKQKKDGDYSILQKNLAQCYSEVKFFLCLLITVTTHIPLLSTVCFIFQ